VYLQATPPQTDKAAAIYRRVLEMTPNDLSSLNNLACLLMDEVQPPRPEEALKYASRAYDIMAKSGEIQPLLLDTYGWTLIHNNRVAEGMNMVRDALDRSDFAEARYHLGVGYMKQSQAAEARDELQKAKDLAEKQKGFPLATKERIQQAWQEADKAVKSKAN